MISNKPALNQNTEHFFHPKPPGSQLLYMPVSSDNHCLRQSLFYFFPTVNLFVYIFNEYFCQIKFLVRILLFQHFQKCGFYLLCFTAQEMVNFNPIVLYSSLNVLFPLAIFRLFSFSFNSSNFYYNGPISDFLSIYPAYHRQFLTLS